MDFHFTKSSETHKAKAKKEHRFYGNFARVRKNACDECYSVDYKSPTNKNGKVNSNGLSIRDANKFARCIEEFHTIGVMKVPVKLKNRFDFFYNQVMQGISCACKLHK